jgi:dihydrodipicolinate synthase/N-acetylneuraminate lyase
MTLDVRDRLLSGLVIPAHPLALDRDRRLDERRQRALTRYYLDAGAGGIAVGVHTTQFSIRDLSVGLYEPVLSLAGATIDEHQADGEASEVVRIAGVIGDTRQAAAEARIARDLGYHVALVSLGGIPGHSISGLIDHVRAVGEIMPVMGFYLQPAVGGRDLPADLWRGMAELDQVVGIKIAPFDRYKTLEVVRAVVEAGRADEVALYTGNDDHIILDLLTPYRFGTAPAVHVVGGLLGQWAVWTRRAVEIHGECRRIVQQGDAVPQGLLTTAAQLSDANGAIFDAAHGYAGCLPGIHEILRRQELLAGTWCLRSEETLSPGQTEEIDRVLTAYPHLCDDAFVARNRDRWLA